MEGDLDQFKAKINDYSVDELEEVLVSLNKDKFPKKYQIAREALALKKGVSPLYSSSDISDEQKTEVDSIPGQQSRPEKPAEVSNEAIQPSAPSSPPLTTATQPSQLAQPPPVSPAKPAIKLSEPSKTIVPQPRVAPLQHRLEPQQEENEGQPQKTGFFYSFFLFLVFLSSVCAVYVMLLSYFNLPGKTELVNFSKNLPSLTFIHPPQTGPADTAKEASAESSSIKNEAAPE
ncbi:MAG: hypothetical protein JW774_00730 [Candidatus Aureabacteria bacterium]|nr:hypothetical protein [Candidatus Auribacterota bacterium]